MGQTGNYSQNDGVIDYSNYTNTTAEHNATDAYYSQQYDSSYLSAAVAAATGAGDGGVDSRYVVYFRSTLVMRC